MLQELSIDPDEIIKKSQNQEKIFGLEGKGT